MQKESQTTAPVPPPPRTSNRLHAALGTLNTVNTALVDQGFLGSANNAAKASEERLKDLNFKVNEDFHVEFKITATKRKMSMKDLLEACFEAWKDKHGGISPGLFK